MSDGRCTIRPARPDDADAVVALWWEMAREHSAYDGECWEWAQDALAAWREFLMEFITAADRVALVAVDAGDNPVGFILAMVSDAPAVHAVKRRGAITDVAVRPADRRKGIGRKLTEAALRAIKDLGAESVHLSVAASNEPARSLYEHMGMRIVMHQMYKRL